MALRRLKTSPALLLISAVALPTAATTGPMNRVPQSSSRRLQYPPRFLSKNKESRTRWKQVPSRGGSENKTGSHLTRSLQVSVQPEEPRTPPCSPPGAPDLGVLPGNLSDLSPHFCHGHQARTPVLCCPGHWNRLSDSLRPFSILRTVARNIF